jgi:hypothetical protein
MSDNERECIACGLVASTDTFDGAYCIIKCAHAAEVERERIVEWLRGPLTHDDTPHDVLTRIYAGAIERGEHMEEQDVR